MMSGPTSSGMQRSQSVVVVATAATVVGVALLVVGTGFLVALFRHRRTGTSSTGSTTGSLNVGGIDGSQNPTRISGIQEWNLKLKAPTCWSVRVRHGKSRRGPAGGRAMTSAGSKTGATPGVTTDSDLDYDSQAHRRGATVAPVSVVALWAKSTAVIPLSSILPSESPRARRMRSKRERKGTAMTPTGRPANVVSKQLQLQDADCGESKQRIPEMPSRSESGSRFGATSRRIFAFKSSIVQVAPAGPGSASVSTTRPGIDSGESDQPPTRVNAAISSLSILNSRLGALPGSLWESSWFKTGRS